MRKTATTINICADLTLTQRRAFNVLMYAALPRLGDTTEHQLSLNALAWAMTGDPRATRNLRGIVADLKAMMSQIVEWDTLGEDGGTGEWEASVLVPWIRIRRDGMVVFRFTPEFQAQMQRDLRSVEIALEAPLGFRSVYTLALYEHVRLYADAGETPWLGILQVLKLFGKRAEGYYQDFRRLNNKILRDAIETINRRSEQQRPIRCLPAVATRAVTDGWRDQGPPVARRRAPKRDPEPAGDSKTTPPQQPTSQHLLAGLDSAARERLTAEFERYLGDGEHAVIRGLYRRHGWSSRTVLAELERFLRERERARLGPRAAPACFVATRASNCHARIRPWVARAVSDRREPPSGARAPNPRLP